MITELVIDRKLWMRGYRYRNFQTKLLSVHKKKADGEQYMCCLGQLCLAMGMKEEDIEGISLPEKINQTIEGMDWWNDNGDFAQKAIPVNDHKDLSDSEREVELIPVFQEVGITLSFTGE